MAKVYYRGTVQDRFPMKSSNKGTDGIEIVIDIHSKKYGIEFQPIDRITRRVNIYFPKGGNHEYALKKLRYAGWDGGGLSDLKLVGKDVDVVGEVETYEGQDREKFDLPLPPREGGSGFGNEKSEEAGLAIDAILSSAPIDIDAAKEAEDQTSAGEMSAAPDTGFDEDGVPF
jgi:hypothetical protein